MPSRIASACAGLCKPFETAVTRGDMIGLGMRFLQAGERRFVSLELDAEVIAGIAEQAGFDCEIREGRRQWVLRLSLSGEADSFLLFDACDPTNLGWFSRCQFYVDGLSGAVLQTPLTIGNFRQDGRLRADRLHIGVSVELPAGSKLPGGRTINEQSVYNVLFNLLEALRENGVAVCGGGSIEALTGPARRTEARP